MSEEKHNKKLFQNPDVLKWIIIGLAGFIVIILIFGAGMKVGTLKAKYSYRWADNYHKNFGGPSRGFVGNWRSFPRSDFIEGHGAFGEIIEINASGFVIQGRGDIEKIIVTTKDTVIKKGRETVEGELQVGIRAVIIGSPNEEGQIEAKLIRIFDGEKTNMLYKRSRSHSFFK